VDYDYRGPVGVVLFNHGQEDFAIVKGDRVAQLILERICMARVEEVRELSETKRGAGGFGSTGVQQQQEGGNGGGGEEEQEGKRMKVAEEEGGELVGEGGREGNVICAARTSSARHAYSHCLPFLLTESSSRAEGRAAAGHA